MILENTVSQLDLGGYIYISVQVLYLIIGLIFVWVLLDIRKTLKFLESDIVKILRLK